MISWSPTKRPRYCKLVCGACDNLPLCPLFVFCTFVEASHSWCDHESFLCQKAISCAFLCFSSLSLQGEAKRWKERGKQLFKENKFDLLVDCYSLAINYAPTSDRELLAQLLCNRSLVHVKNKTFKVALLDAERCVKIRPNWSKVS